MSETASSERNLKLEDCITSWQMVASMTQAKTGGLETVIDAYHRNLDRVHALTAFPPVLIQTAMTLTRVTVTTYEKYKDQVASGKIADAELEALVHKRLDETQTRRKKRIESGDQKMKDIYEREQKIAFGFLENSFNKLGLSSGAEAWMSAQITGVWTAFESMAEELWRIALNLHPEGLSELKGGKRGSSEDKKIDMSFLHRHSYDLSDKMGDVLCERYSFDKLEDIRKAYRDAFYCDEDKINAVIEDRSLDAISLTRHAIVHNGGIIDEKFLRRKADLPAGILGEAGKPLPLDGLVVRTLIVPVISKGWQLIESVDQWLDTHN